jgi:predicted dehydrogenase
MSENEKTVLKCGVAGAGVFGGYHANQYAKLPGAELAAVYDLHLDRAEAVAGPLGGQAFDDLDAFLRAVDLVSVTTPATTHAMVAKAALKAGRHAYVEKPLATTVEDAEGLLELAAKQKRVLAVGHQERMVFRAMGLFDVPERPIYLEAVRMGTYSPRNSDVSCVLDLMVHDIDLTFALDPTEAIAVEAEGRIAHGPYFDEVKAEATFESGLTAVLTASRIAEARDRRMRLVYPSGEVEIDFLARTFRNTTPFALNPDFAATPVGKDPLGSALKAFLAVVVGDHADLPAGPKDGVRALDLALAVEQAAGG